jgi:hypothetical protein
MILQTFILLALIGYMIMYISSRKYNEEGFHGISQQLSPQPIQKAMIPPEKPYMKEPIDSLDQYELSAVYQRQGSKEATKKQLNDAMTRYPLDWSVQGPASGYFQEKQEEYQRQSEKTDVVNAYGANESTDMMLPDSALQEEEERKILQTYQPQKSSSLLNYSADDVKTLVEKIYDKRGLIPELVKSKQGQNVWEIIEVKEKNPNIVWEDDKPMKEREKMNMRGEEVIDVPYMVSDVSAGLDPFFQKSRSVRDGRFDYTEWSPGLERMFAPTQPIKDWY